MLQPAMVYDSRNKISIFTNMEPPLDDKAHVVIQSGRYNYGVYLYTAGKLRNRLLSIGEADSGVTFEKALRLSSHVPSVRHEAEDLDASERRRGVVLLDGKVLGVWWPQPSAQAVRQRLKNHPQVSPHTRVVIRRQRIRSPQWPTRDHLISAVERLERSVLYGPLLQQTTQDAWNVLIAEADASSRVYPLITFPRHVLRGHTAALIVTLSAADTSGHPAIAAIDLTAFPETFDLEVHVISAQFNVVTGNAPGQPGTLKLSIDRHDLKGTRLEIQVLALEDAPLGAAVLALQFTYRGQPVARAWATITIDDTAEENPEAGDTRADTQASALRFPTGAEVDLVVYIDQGAAPGELLWQFSSPLALPAFEPQQLRSRVDSDNGQTFAARVVALMENPGAGSLLNIARGIGKEVSGVYPNSFFEVLGTILRRKRLPSVLLVTDELYVPWELVCLSAPEDGIEWPIAGNQLLPDVPDMFGAQCVVGRWIPPRQPQIKETTSAARYPPDRQLIRRMALIVSDYHNVVGAPALPEADREGTDLAKSFPAITLRCPATSETVQRLLSNALTEKDVVVPVQAVHFAGHGQMQPGDPAGNGLILEDGRLQATAVLGSQFGKERPFVFLNACQVGQAEASLATARGMAWAFLKTGCAGFIAPLWTVNDLVAREVAGQFYDAVLTGSCGVGEAVRAIRAEFAKTSTTTPLAYVYYGHPNLQLSPQAPEPADSKETYAQP